MYATLRQRASLHPKAVDTALDDLAEAGIVEVNDFGGTVIVGRSDRWREVKKATALATEPVPVTTRRVQTLHRWRA
jgi:DNA-binding transcriptional regulator YhcF (GntR family)